jgi:hypothetical protein
MLRWSIAAAIAAVTVAGFVASDHAGARSGGGGGGHAGAGGFNRSGVAQFGARRFFSSGAGFNSFHRRFAAARALSANRRFFRSPFTLALPDGGLLYGTYDDMFGFTGSYAPYGAGMEAANPSGEPTFLQAAIYRPPCRMQTQTRAVPSQDGGSRDVTITRCVRPAIPPLARPDWDSGSYVADRNRPDVETSDFTASTVMAGLREPNFVRAGGCRSETRTVPAEGGGERHVTITRC